MKSGFFFRKECVKTHPGLAETQARKVDKAGADQSSATAFVYRGSTAGFPTSRYVLQQRKRVSVIPPVINRGAPASECAHTSMDRQKSYPKSQITIMIQDLQNV